eukprot:470399_1
MSQQYESHSDISNQPQSHIAEYNRNRFADNQFQHHHIIMHEPQISPHSSSTISYSNCSCSYSTPTNFVNQRTVNPSQSLYPSQPSISSHNNNNNNNNSDNIFLFSPQNFEFGQENKYKIAENRYKYHYNLLLQMRSPINHKIISYDAKISAFLITIWCIFNIFYTIKQG